MAYHPKDTSYSYSDPYGAQVEPPQIDYRAVAKLGAIQQPERQTLTTTVEELAHLSNTVRDLADRLRLAIDSQYYHQNNAAVQGQSAPTSVPHLGENLDIISGRLYSAISNLESLLEFVGR